MNKFFILLKKEIKELLTLQMIIPMLVSVLIFVFIGQIMKAETKKSKEKKVALYILFEKEKDNASLNPLNNEMINFFTKSGAIILHKEIENFDLMKEVDYAKEKKIDYILLIKKDYFNFLINRKVDNVQFEIYSIIKSFGGISFSDSNENYISEMLKIFNKYIFSINYPDEKFIFYENPVNYKSYVFFNGKFTEGTISSITGFLYSQTIFIPIIVYLLIILSSQMVAVAVATEKENKTLETLLSMPIKRSYIASSKMIAGGIVSLLMALIYIVGFNFYIKGVTSISGSNATESINKISLILRELNLRLNFFDYILILGSIFSALLNVLAISLILGLFAEDVKKVQIVITPIMFLTLIPYFISIFFNINDLSVVLKLLIILIPFSNPFFVINLLLVKNYQLVIIGIIYQFIVFFIFIILTTKIFKSDKILTMKIKLKN